MLDGMAVTLEERTRAELVYAETQVGPDGGTSCTLSVCQVHSLTARKVVTAYSELKV